MRKFVVCTPAFLKTKLEELKDQFGDDLFTKDGDYTGFNVEAFTKKIWKDIRKVDFDFENYSFESEDAYSGCKLITGHQIHDNGMPYFGVVAGGDWEMPVFFIIYWSGTELRGYVPTDGNVWNTDHKSAYGNNEDDSDNIKKRWPELFDERSDDVCIDDCPDCDPAKILIDIAARITPREAHNEMGEPRTAHDIAESIEPGCTAVPEMLPVELSDKERRILSIVYISAMEHDRNDWEEMCDATEEELNDLYTKLTRSE